MAKGYIKIIALRALTYDLVCLTYTHYIKLYLNANKNTCVVGYFQQFEIIWVINLF